MGYRGFDAAGLTPLFPFGYGLSYATFGLSNLAVTPTAGGGATVAATVTNTGSRAGTAVPQLYLGHPVGAGEPPRELRGARRVTLAGGASARLSFAVTPTDLRIWGSTGWTVPHGRYAVSVGFSLRSERCNVWKSNWLTLFTSLAVFKIKVVGGVF